MSTKSSKVRLIIVVGIVVLVGAAGTLTTFFIMNSNQSPSLIAPGSSLEDARKLSAGEKDACLTDNRDAIAAVKADDTYLDEAKEFSNFELTASAGIMDVPAGTNYETTIQRYDGTLAQGAIIYEGDYGTYNYTIEKTGGAGEWRFVSMVACK